MIALDDLFAGIEQAGITAAAGALTRGADSIRDRAKELAPVRKVFKGQDRHYRIALKSIESIEADVSIRKKLGLGPEHPYLNPPTIVTKRAPQSLSTRSVAEPGRLRSAQAQGRLDRRGRYELASGRAVASIGGSDELGGRLRNEIYSIEARIKGRKIIARVVSPTEYAKYQEFGTRHNPAHPYLRPAGHEKTGDIKLDVRRSVTTAARQAAGGRRRRVATITIKLKAAR